MPPPRAKRPKARPPLGPSGQKAPPPSRARQLAIDLEREETLGRDAAGSVERLDAEEAGLREAHAGHDEALLAAQDVARGAAEQLSEQETALDRLTEEAARLAARAAAAERRREEARGAIQRLDEDIARVEDTERSLAAEIGRVRASLTTAEAAETEARAEREAAERALEAAEAARAAAQTAEAEARAAFSEIEGEITALNAEAQALERLMAREAGATPSRSSTASTVGGGHRSGAGCGTGRRPARSRTGAGRRGPPAGSACLPTPSSAALPDGAETLAAQVDRAGTAGAPSRPGRRGRARRRATRCSRS